MPLAKHHNNTILVPYKGKSMPTLTLKNIPDGLYHQLKEAANAHHRSLNREILYCVEQTLRTHKINVQEHLEVAQRLRAKSANHLLTEQILSDAKCEGRP